MKMYQVLLITAIVAVTLCGDAVAQERLFGNGRFLRRLRGDITGPKTPEPKAKTPKLAEPKKTPKKLSKAAPTPASKAIPTRSEAFYGDSKKTKRKEIGSGKIKGETSPRTVLGSSTSPSIPKQSSRKSTLGFGMLIENVKENLVVTDVDERGNAIGEDIRKRDILVSVGGVEITNLQEFNEITDILREGDQIEMGFTRRGKELKKKIVQLGKDPKPTAVAPNKTPSLDDRIESLTDAPKSGLQSVMSGAQPRGANQDLIRRQQKQIDAMKRELQRLRQSQSAPPSQGGSVLEGPSLSGPGL